MSAQLAVLTPTILSTSCASTTSPANFLMPQTSSVSTIQPTMLPSTCKSSPSSLFPPPTIASDTLLSTEATAPMLVPTTLFLTVASALLSAFWRRNLPYKNTETTQRISSPPLLTSLKSALSMTSQEAFPKFQLVTCLTTSRETVSSPAAKISKLYSAELTTTPTNF